MPRSRLSRLTLSKDALCPLGWEIAYVVKYAKKWEMDPARTASEFDAGYYRGLLEKAWAEAAFIFNRLKK